MVYVNIFDSPPIVRPCVSTSDACDACLTFIKEYGKAHRDHYDDQ